MVWHGVVRCWLCGAGVALSMGIETRAVQFGTNHSRDLQFEMSPALPTERAAAMLWLQLLRRNIYLQ